MTVRGYTLAIDWSRAGTYAGTLEDVTGYVLDNPVITVEYGRDSTQVANQAGAGRMQFALENDGREFSPENTSSPITGKILPGRHVRLDKLLSAVLYTIYDGVIDGFDVDPTAAARDFSATCLDGWGQPGAEKLSTPLYTGIRTGTAIGLVLDEIGWTGPRDLDPGATVMPFWWEEGSDASTAINRLIDSEGPPALALVEGGTFIFRDRHHRLTRTASTTTNGLFTHIIPAGSGPGGDYKVLKDTFIYDHGLRSIANVATFSVAQRAPDQLQEVWFTDTPITLAAGESIAIEIQTADPFMGALVPVLDVDYLASFGTITASLSRTSGQSALLTLTAGGVAAQVDRIGVRATPLPVVRTVKVTEEDTSSINTYDIQTWPRELPFAGVYDARAIAQRIVSTYATNRPTVTFEIANVDDTYLTQILARKISDRITIRNDAIGINRDFIIERKAQSIQKLGGIHKARFTCEVVEPTQGSTVLTFDVAGKGFNDGVFGTNGIDNAATMLRFDTAGQGFNDGRFSS